MSNLFITLITLSDVSFSFSYSLFDFRLPRIHNRQFRNNAKLILHLISYVTTLNSSIRFIELRWPSFLTNIEHSLPILPVAERTSDVKVPCSMFKIRELHSLFFSSLLISYHFHRVLFWRRWELQANTLMLKNAFYTLIQNPLALMLDLALSYWFPFISSSDNCYKSGSNLTFLVTFSGISAMLSLKFTFLAWYCVLYVV